ncbi:MAG: insulinase family protein [Candidatus Krumholzibacteriota bacterium]|nr:insulinase family protein [Candidatus Krumholzibacteriota bacterium]
MLKLPRPQRIVLESGARLLYQRNPVSPTVAFGVWITRGSRDEKSSERGYSHLLEHMVFRGTVARSALEIALDLETIGGQWDAYTGKEETCYHGKVLEENFESLADIFADIVLYPSIPLEALPIEKKIIMEEIRSVADSPEESAYEYFFQNLYYGNQLGYPVTGSIEDVAGSTRRRLISFRRRTYNAQNAVLVFIGNIPVNKVVSILDRRFRFSPGAAAAERKLPRFKQKRSVHVRRSDLSQSHICAGVRVGSASDPERYPLLVLSNILGGGVSSRMFQSLREESGLAYSIFSSVNFWKDTGAFSTFFSVDPKNLSRAVDLYKRETVKIMSDGLRKEELESAIAQIKGSVIFGIESVDSRMFRLFHNYFHYDRYLSLPSLIKSIEEVSLDDLMRVAEKYLGDENHIYVNVGPKKLKGIA